METEMANLKDDPKVVALVEKEVKKAVTAERKRALDVVKAQVEANKETEDKATRNIVATTLKAVTAALKEAA
jgi:hypothetical protein